MCFLQTKIKNTAPPLHFMHHILALFLHEGGKQLAQTHATATLNKISVANKLVATAICWKIIALV